MSLAGCQINLIDVIFHLQNSLKIFDKSSPEKIWSRKDKGVESALPYDNFFISAITWHDTSNCP